MLLTHFTKLTWPPEDFDDFCIQVNRKARSEPLDMKTTEWRFWWFRLYQWLNSQTKDVKKDAWALIDWKRKQVSHNNAAGKTYGYKGKSS